MGDLYLRILGLKHAHAEIHGIVHQLTLQQIGWAVRQPHADIWVCKREIS